MIGKKQTGSRVPGSLDQEEYHPCHVAQWRQLLVWLVFIDAAAVTHQLTKGVDAGYGFTGIIIAWMSGPQSIHIYCGLSLSWLLSKRVVMLLQMTMKLPNAMGAVLQGLILIPLLAGNIFIEYRLLVIKTRKEVTA